MEKIKIHDAEMQLMVKIWEDKNIKAIDLANWATENLGWKKNSTYSMLKKLIEKKAVSRHEPGFLLIPLVTKDEIATDETNTLIDKMYKGSMKMFLTSLIQRNDLNVEEVDALKKLIENATDNDKE